MVRIEIDHTKHWHEIPADTRIIVALFNDGHKETMSIYEYLAMGRKVNKVSVIECYKEGENVEL